MKIYKICELGKTITGCTPSTKIKDYYNEGKFMFAGPTDIKTSRFINSTDKNISIKAYNDYKTRFINKGDIAVSCIGYLGYVSVATDYTLTNQQINSITNIDSAKVLPMYLYYKLCTMKKLFESIGGNGTALPIISKSLFDRVEVEVHGIDQQQHIVNSINSEVKYAC